MRGNARSLQVTRRIVRQAWWRVSPVMVATLLLLPGGVAFAAPPSTESAQVRAADPCLLRCLFPNRPSPGGGGLINEVRRTVAPVVQAVNRAVDDDDDDDDDDEHEVRRGVGVARPAQTAPAAPAPSNRPAPAVAPQSPPPVVAAAPQPAPQPAPQAPPQQAYVSQPSAAPVAQASAPDAQTSAQAAPSAEASAKARPPDTVGGGAGAAAQRPRTGSLERTPGSTSAAPDASATPDTTTAAPAEVAQAAATEVAQATTSEPVAPPAVVAALPTAVVDAQPSPVVAEIAAAPVVAEVAPPTPEAVEQPVDAPVASGPAVSEPAVSEPVVSGPVATETVTAEQPASETASTSRLDKAVDHLKTALDDLIAAATDDDRDWSLPLAVVCGLLAGLLLALAVARWRQADDDDGYEREYPRLPSGAAYASGTLGEHVYAIDYQQLYAPPSSQPYIPAYQPPVAEYRSYELDFSQPYAPPSSQPYIPAYQPPVADYISGRASVPPPSFHEAPIDTYMVADAATYPAPDTSRSGLYTEPGTQSGTSPASRISPAHTGSSHGSSVPYLTVVEDMSSSWPAAGREQPMQTVNDFAAGSRGSANETIVERPGRAHTPSPTPPPADNLSQIASARCTRCGHVRRSGRRYCSQCGELLFSNVS